MSALRHQEFQKCFCLSKAFAEPEHPICNKTWANPSTIKAGIYNKSPSTNQDMQLLTAEMHQGGWKSLFGFKFRSECFKPEARKHLNEMRYHRGQENHYSENCKQWLIKQLRNNPLNTATNTEINTGRHNKMPLKTTLFFHYLDYLILLSSLISPMTYLQATYHPGKGPKA